MSTGLTAEDDDNPKFLSLSEWISARKELLAKEYKLTRGSAMR